MRLARAAFGGVGVALIAVGGLLVLRDVKLLAIAPWLVVPVAVHDLLLAPLTILVVWVGARFLPSYARTPAMFGLVISGGLTLVALSVLGRRGADPLNPSLLNRNYVAGWLAALALTWLAVLLAALVRRAASRGPARRA